MFTTIEQVKQKKSILEVPADSEGRKYLCSGTGAYMRNMSEQEVLDWANGCYVKNS